MPARLSRIESTTAVSAMLLTLLCLRPSDALNYMGFGPRLNFVVAETVGAGIGAGGQGQFGFDLGRAGAIHAYPNFEVWFGHEDYGAGPAPFNYDRDLYAVEITINLDARYYFPLPPSVPVAPYAGLGIAAPVIDLQEWKPGDDDVDVGAAFNMFGGLDIPVGRHKFFAEMKGKFGDGYNLFKMTAGFTFSVM
jgi:hypothetical protein